MISRRLTGLVLLFVFTTVLFNACKNKENDKKIDIQKNSVTSSSKIQVEDVLNDYMKAWAEHDIAKIASHYHANVTWYDLPSNNLTKGKAKVTKAITDAFMGYVPDMYWVKRGDFFVSGNTAIYEWTYGGTFNGDWGNKHIKNKKFSIQGISTTTIDDNGKIISQKDYYDLDSFKRSVGAIK